MTAARTLIGLALAEDLGETGDRTTLATISATTMATAAFVVRTPGVVAGIPVAMMAMQALDAKLKINFTVEDGTVLAAKTTIGTVTGSLRSILIAERTALNFLQRLSGVATLTRKFVDAIAGTSAVILDTRKTTPGWRILDKYAVRCGGGVNHRIGLYDAILIKDNHIAGVGGEVVEAVTRARSYAGNAGLPVEIEVDSLEQLEAVLSVKPEIVLLDNMSTDLMKQAVSVRNRLAPATKLEASGGVNLSTVRGIAETGVDRISVGAITHSAPALDTALDIPT
ncbi:carboxylating nicotinate-nucleotide diphosphorylase [soil metagenome]